MKLAPIWKQELTAPVTKPRIRYFDGAWRLCGGAVPLMARFDKYMTLEGAVKGLCRLYLDGQIKDWREE